MTFGPPTLAIGGPTATGKTALAVELALLSGAELINADSRQVVRRLRVGTAAPTEAELLGVPCHLLDQCEPGQSYTVAEWLAAARTVLADLDARGVPAIVVGGTGQYLRALREGWDLGGAAPDPATRAALTEEVTTEEGRARLVGELRGRDPAAAAAIDISNPRRVIRALEVLRSGGGSLAERRGRRGGRPLALVVLDVERSAHEPVLAARMDAMFGAGALVAEVRAELAQGTSPAALRRAGIGYAEALDVIECGAAVGAARAATLARTRRYVKAQRTWFRHEAAELRLVRDAATPLASLVSTVLDWVPGALPSHLPGTARSAAPPR